MRFNLLISNFSGTFNILNTSEDQCNKIVHAYLSGENSVTISGRKYIIERISEFRVFTFEPEGDPEEVLKYYQNNISFRVNYLFGYYLPVDTLLRMGKEVTDEIIGDAEQGEKKVSAKNSVRNSFVNENRIEELRSIKSNKFDLVRLIKLCEEINDNYSNNNFMSVAIIARAVLDHIPPIFNQNTFDNVANNYGGIEKSRSFKKTMLHLNGSLRNIADRYLHQVIRSSETLPNETQVNFSQDLDVLLDEIVRILK